MSAVPLLKVSGLSKRFAARRSLLGRTLAEVRAVDGVDLAVNAGETLAIVGESGCGKSTLGRLVLRLIDPSEGSILFDGTEVAGLQGRTLRGLRRHAQLIFQDPFASLNPRMTVGDILEEPLMLHAVVPAGQRKARVRELLVQVGLRPDHAARFPHEFSGGQRQRIAIARAIAVEPKLIVCDEPVSALDVSIRAQILNLLQDLQKRLALSTIFISHDLAVVRHIADRVAVMYLGRIVETGPTAALFSSPRHPYTRALIAAIPVPEPEARRERVLMQGDVPSPIAPPPGCHLHTRCPHAVGRCAADRPSLEETGGGAAVACWRWREIGPPAASLAGEGRRDPRLERLMQAFAPEATA